MKAISMIGATLIGAAILVASPVSLQQSQDKGLSVSLNSAEARIGRPLTPGVSLVSTGEFTEGRRAGAILDWRRLRSVVY